MVFGVVLAMGLSLLLPATASAAVDFCKRDPRTAVAQMCASMSTHMYGSFTTFLYPTVGHSTSSAGTAYNATRVFTDDNLSTSYELGLSVGWGSPTGQTTYQPYWVDYTGGYDYRPIGTFSNSPDDRPHTFTSFPHCDNCRSSDLFYDFNYVGTTKDGVSPNSHHMVTGWDVGASTFGDVTFPRTANRIQWFNGNRVFERFPASAITTRAPAGNCSVGANPAFCFRFDTTVAKDTSGYVTAWEAAKPLVQPGVRTAAESLGQAAAVATVDQDVLRQCMDEDASRCLDTVPGLRDCVHKRLVCNESAATTQKRSTLAPMTTDRARAAAVEFLASRRSIDNADAVSVTEDGDVITVVFKQPVRELTGDHRAHDRAQLTYDRASRGLLSVRMS